MPAGQTGRQRVELHVEDGRGGSAPQGFDIDITPRHRGPSLAISVQPDPVNVGGTATIVVSGTDNIGITNFTLVVDGVAVPVDASGRASVRLPRIGLIAAEATARDAAGNVGRASRDIRVIDPTDIEAPVVEFVSPEINATVSGPVDVIGTVQDSNLLFYTIEVARAGSDDFVVLDRGTAPVLNGKLGVLDPSALANDSYTLRLSATDAGGRTSRVDRPISIEGDLKLGHFTLAFTDVEVPVTGIPITISRIYDTHQAAVSSDFGFGWRLDFANTDLRTNIEPTDLESYGIFNHFRDFTRVYVTLPDGRREGFTFEPKLAPGLRGSFLGIFDPHFEPDDGVTSTLTVQRFDLRHFDDGTYEDYFGSLPYNPANSAFGGFYTLTTKEGVSYTIDGLSGRMTRAADVLATSCGSRPKASSATAASASCSSATRKAASPPSSTRWATA